eukprot:NODE_9_length_64580_cov_1.431941.p51 type:complete len:118 gc:universal NODE_9_length_64580_cov_1.431941:25849-26202(+)
MSGNLDLNGITSQLNQLHGPLEQLVEFNTMNWQQIQSSYQIIIERFQRLIDGIGENLEQTLLYPFKPTGTKALYPMVYLRSKPEPFIEDYLNDLKGVDTSEEYDAEIEAALLLFEEE